MEAHETKHSMKHRSPWHNYSKKGTYMLTLVVEGRVPLLGELKGNAEAALGSPNAPRVEYSELGSAILSDETGKISQFYPQIEVWKVCIMPDHIHMIVRVKEDLPGKKHLGMAVAGFKGGCSKAAMRLGATISPLNLSERSGNGGKNDSSSGNGSATVPPSSDGANLSGGGARNGNSSGVVPLFEAGYNDKILIHEGQLDNWRLISTTPPGVCL